MGLHAETCVRDYWAQGTNRSTHPLNEIMSRERYEAIHARMRLATADPKAEFEAVFERMSTRSKYLTSL
jgi:Transposase IS4